MVGSGRDERAWVRRAQAGSVSDLEALFRAHWPRAYRAAYVDWSANQSQVSIWEATHEIGHLMGGSDRYDPVTGNPNPGFDGNIMAQTFGRPWALDIDRIVRQHQRKNIRGY